MSSGKILFFAEKIKYHYELEGILKTNGYHVYSSEDGDSASEVLTAVNPDLVLLDVSLSYKGSLEICRVIRSKSEVPILFLADQQSMSNVVRGLEMGGDHFVIRPYKPEVLFALIKAIFRRFPPKGDQLSLDDLNINFSTKEVIVAGRHISLPAKEREFLFLFARNPNRVFTLEQLYHEIWGSSSYGDNRTVLVHISNLRKKLGEDPSNPRYIQTVRGQGYVFRI
ncbi:response regulator transcription factor [Brevibacillus sp. SYSU BS000544]|uniref:response regulator transcription factor n=1 Tax=Brevibacillus sp. SYSU BS000544 TaxID=3416443 RepID=UPI003CE4739C